MTGRLYAGGAALDVATAMLSIRDSVIPPTTKVAPARRYRIDLVTVPVPATLRTAVVIARGHGGFNSVLVVRALPRESPTIEENRCN
jgi:act minimal PKS chain-length factor (CLF/KS beta)